MNYENQAWLDNWLRLKAKAEQKDFNNLVSVKEKVRTIAFIQQGYTGKVIIEDYPELTQLNLSNNELEEIIIRNCPDLKLVSLGHNKLTKLKIENCPSIQEIYTHNNQLTKWEVDVEDLKDKNLRTISYSANPLTSEEKTRLDALGLPDRVIKSRVDDDAQTWLDAKYPLDIRDSIEKLDISGLGLQGNLKLANFTNLKKLDCSDNELTGLILYDCEKLEYLDCSNNCQVVEIEEIEKVQADGSKKIEKNFIREGIIALDLSENKELQEVHANNVALKFLMVENLTKLHTLNLVANELTGYAPAFDDLVNLLYLNVSLNQLIALDLTTNTKLKTLFCYKNQIEELHVWHLQDLEYLFCHHNRLSGLDCADLKKLVELNCANASTDFDILFSSLDINGCDNLEILDCAENGGLNSLFLTNLPKLNFISLKESGLAGLEVSNCPNLEFLDFSRQVNRFKSQNGEKIIVFIPTTLLVDTNSTANLKKLYYSSNAKNVPCWKTMPKLEKLGIGEEKLVKEDGKDKTCYFVDEIDVLGLRNTEKIQNLLAKGEDNITFEELDNLDKHDLYGIPNELRQQLLEIGIKKINELKQKFRDEGYGSEEEEQIIYSPEEHQKATQLFIKGVYREITLTEFLNEYQQIDLTLIAEYLQQALTNLISEWENEEIPLPENSELSEVPVLYEQEEPTPELDYKKLYLELLAKIEKGEITTNDNKEIITNSPLTEDKKQELYNLLVKNQNKNNSEQQSSNSLPYVLIIINIISIGIIVYLLSKFKQDIKKIREN